MCVCVSIPLILTCETGGAETFCLHIYNKKFLVTETPKHDFNKLRHYENKYSQCQSLDHTELENYAHE